MKINQPSRELEEIGHEINSFYLKRFNYDYDAAAKAVTNLQVVSLELDGDDLVISLGRPGRLIGAKGTNIDALTVHLDRKIRIVESFHWDEILVPFDYSEY
jgi:hypothetical protein